MLTTFLRTASLAAALALAAPANVIAQTVLTFGGSDAIGSILDRQNLRFTACVNDKAGGRLRVNFIQGEQLGSDMQVIEQMMQGSVHVYGDVLDWYANWVKDYAILAWGFTFRDADHMQKFLDSPTYAAMSQKLLKEQGLRILAAAPTQPRILFSKKPVASLADLNGVKMRVPEIKTYLTLWETLGTRPSRLAWGEIYLGLKTGVVEAAEGPISSAYSAKFHEAATNVVRTDHLMSSAHITMNEKAYAALPPDMQKLMVDCASDAVQNTRRTAQQETEDVVRKMAAEGAKVSAIDKAPIQQRAKEGVAKMEKDGAWSPGLWDQIQKL
ncbi:MAG: TRAP transporter substrate-binding protein [Burkholderiales bacterium]|nr:TRAP transporter substrate-binding protein [Burkholderiales bacterium]MCC7114002.1 TRAP transporter substrate-binding protein [Burkholderiales bacterium]